MALDVRAVTRGALGAVLLFGPAMLVLRALSDGDIDSSAWVVLLVFFPFAFMFGGWLSAYEKPRTPLLHGAVASAAGFAVIYLVVLPFRVADGRLSVGSVVIALLLVEAAAVFGMLGGVLAVKGFRVPR